jgi:hypothetical protein
MEQTKARNYNLIAAFDDLTDARHAIERLRDAGLRGDTVSLLGRTGNEIAATDDGKTQDRKSIKDAVVGTVTGAVGGGVLGGLAGFLIGLAVLPVPGVGPFVTAGIWGATAIGAISGSSAGSLVGVLSGAALSNEQDQTYRTHLERGHVLVGVSIDDAAEFEKAFALIVESHPLSIDRYGSGVSAGTQRS